MEQLLEAFPKDSEIVTQPTLKKESSTLSGQRFYMETTMGEIRLRSSNSTWDPTFGTPSNLRELQNPS